MSSPPQIKKKPTAQRQSHGELVEPEIATQLRADIQSWSIPPDDRDGFNVHIGSKGHIVLTQSRPFEHASEIILHPVEARALTKILPAAIGAAKKFRKELAYG